jgi:hypothetical protein
MQRYRVIGPCTVAGVAPGGTVTDDDLTRSGAVVAPLVGVHLEPIKDEKPPTAKKTARDDG